MTRLDSQGICERVGLGFVVPVEMVVKSRPFWRFWRQRFKTDPCRRRRFAFGLGGVQCEGRRDLHATWPGEEVGAVLTTKTTQTKV